MLNISTSKTNNVSETISSQSFTEDEFILSQGYRIVRVIGQGSYAKVLLCEGASNSKTKNKLACKVVDVRNTKAEFIYKFFPRELEVITSLKHPNVVKNYGIYKKEDKFYIFMRFAENKDLLDYIVNNGCISELKTRFWVWQIASALSYMHSLDIVHRDLKCENILLTENYNVKLCDFGFSKIIAKNEMFSSTWCGSLAYASPEILEMKRYSPKKSDAWALGVVMFVMLSKSLPFQEKSPTAMLARQKRKLIFTGKTWEVISLFAKTCLLRLLEVDPRCRWSPDNILSSNWLTEDPRVFELNMNEVRRRKMSPVITIDPRRLSALLKDKGVTESNSKPLSEKSLSIGISESLNFFQNHDLFVHPLNSLITSGTSTSRSNVEETDIDKKRLKRLNNDL